MNPAELFASYWWLVFPLAGMAAGGFRALGASRERAHQRQMELYSLQHPESAQPASALPEAAADGKPAAADHAAADAERIRAEHDAVNKRWLSYELDVAKMIDFPMMSDVRAPLTVAFLRAKRDADALRPLEGSTIADKARLDDYRNAVNAFVVAFDVAEKEARRLKDAGFTEGEKQRLGTARKLINIAQDEAAPPAERQTAFKRVRRELDGVVVLPDVTLAALEQQLARMLER